MPWPSPEQRLLRQLAGLNRCSEFGYSLATPINGVLPLPPSLSLPPWGKGTVLKARCFIFPHSYLAGAGLFHLCQNWRRGRGWNGLDKQRP